MIQIQIKDLNMSNPDQNSLIDLTYLQNMSDGDEGFIKTMIETFLTTVPDIISNIEQYHKAKEWKALAQEIHKLKPTLKYLGVHSLNEIMPETEANCKAVQNIDQIDQGVEHITKVTESVLKAARAKIDA